MLPEESLDPNVTSGASDSSLGPTQAMDRRETARTVIGRYHLLQKIGEGGMGEVWLAEQTELLRRRVALKLIKAGMNTREVISRFESERQTLALMDHPAIAKVFDAGSTPQGAPYFVMEYVAGVPITTYCDNHRLNTRERLELFTQVCEGVQHAHQKAIIHRDLKPSNILVTELDGKATPKIIDFGVAKALSQKLTADTMFTRLGAMVGTPEYMSPEQAASSGEDLDTRTDVYSLGIVLYELLAGVPPIELRKIAFEEFLRRLREEEPPKPSTKIRAQDPAASTDVARKRQAEPLTLARQMRGDLDSIALKALEKDRSRRYGSPSDLAADIERYLKNEAVLAVPPSAAYRARKFARRYRAALVTVAAFVLVLILAAGVSIRQSIRANREAAVAQAVNDFLQNDLLAQADTNTQTGRDKPDPDIKARVLLDRAAAQVAGRFAGQPPVEASIEETIGKAYRGLGLYSEAEPHLQRALDSYRRSVGPEQPETLAAAETLGELERSMGRSAQAESLLQATVDALRRTQGVRQSETLTAMTGLADVYVVEGKYAQARPLLGEVLEGERRALRPDDLAAADTMVTLARLDYMQGDAPGAERMLQGALEIRRRRLGPENPGVLQLLNNLAVLDQSQSRFDEAEALYSTVLATFERVAGPDHPETLNATNNLAALDTDRGKYPEAEALYLKVLAAWRKQLGAEHPRTLTVLSNLALLHFFEGKYAEAESEENGVLEARRRVLGAQNPDTLESMFILARVDAAEGKYPAADSLYEQTLEGRRQALGAKHAATADTLSAMGEARLAEGRYAEAEALLRECLQIRTETASEGFRRFLAEALVGASLMEQRKYADAEPLLVSAYDGLKQREARLPAYDRRKVAETGARIAALYVAWGKPEQALQWRQKLAGN